MKRISIALLALMMPAALLTGCGSGDYPSAEAPAHNGAAGTAAKADAGGDESPAMESPGAALDVEGFAESASADSAAPSDEAPRAEDVMAAADDAGEGEIVDPPEEPEFTVPVDPDAGALILTAGEWNDNENWGFFSNLVKNGHIEFPSFGLLPTGRVSVKCESGGAAARNVKVGLYDENDLVWSAVSDKDGMAYLFFDPAQRGSLTLKAEGAEEIAVDTAHASDGQNGGKWVSQASYTMDLSASPESYHATEVMFILDTTGSMGDEIAYLQKDFTAIVDEVAGENITFSVNFYRDKGDEYVTKCNPFTDDTADLQKKLNQEYADGGGDWPEAVAQILTETMSPDVWSAESNKIAFLIFDAPPHEGTDEEVHAAIANAAEMGVRLVPVVASNSERETELFGRAAAIMTGANYVFLTDDSGVGNSHLEPIIGDYEVELLHDIIVRNIREIAE